MLKLDLNKEKGRISLLELLKLADVIVFTDAFSLLSIGCQFKRVKMRERKILSLPHPHHRLPREKYLKPEHQWEASGNTQSFRDFYLYPSLHSSPLFSFYSPLIVSWQSKFYCVIIHWFLVSSCAFKKEKQNIIF